MPRLRRRHAALALAAASLALLGPAACRRAQAGPRELLERYFSTAVRQEYAATWECYDGKYQSKVSRDEFVAHRREASRLQSWRILSLDERGNRARAEVELVFAPSERLGRQQPARATVREDLVREPKGWRIQVWESAPDGAPRSLSRAAG